MQTHPLVSFRNKACFTALLAVALAPVALPSAVAFAQDTPNPNDPATYNVDGAKTVLPLLICYYNGGKSYYLTTDASDAAVAKSFGANYVPQLANVLLDTEHKSFDNIYVFTNSKQYNVLPSSPNPVGPTSTDPSYTPLWQLTQVTWRTKPRVLKSEAEILEAQARGELTVTPTNIIINCPVVYTSFGGRQPQAKVIIGTSSKDNDDKDQR